MLCTNSCSSINVPSHVGGWVDGWTDGAGNGKLRIYERGTTLTRQVGDYAKAARETVGALVLGLPRSCIKIQAYSYRKAGLPST